MKPFAPATMIRAGSRLVLTYTGDGAVWSIDSIAVTAEQARLLIRDLRLRPAGDALFAGAEPQTWVAGP